MASNDVAADLVERQSIRAVIQQIMRAGQRAQMLADCAAICPRCRGIPDAPDEYVRPAHLDSQGRYRHEWGIAGAAPIGTQSCAAALIRMAWAAAHPEESTDGNR